MGNLGINSFGWISVGQHMVFSLIFRSQKTLKHVKIFVKPHQSHCLPNSFNWQYTIHVFDSFCWYIEWNNPRQNKWSQLENKQPWLCLLCTKQNIQELEVGGLSEKDAMDKRRRQQSGRETIQRWDRNLHGIAWHQNCSGMRFDRENQSLSFWWKVVEDSFGGNVLEEVFGGKVFWGSFWWERCGETFWRGLTDDICGSHSRFPLCGTDTTNIILHKGRHPKKNVFLRKIS